MASTDKKPSMKSMNAPGTGTQLPRLEIDPRIDLTKPIYEQVLKLEAKDARDAKRQERASLPMSEGADPFPSTGRRPILLDLDPRIDLTKPIYEQAMKLAAKDRAKKPKRQKPAA